MMRITPLAVWASGLESSEDLYKAVVTDVELTHPNKLVHQSIFIYCQAIQFLLNNPECKTRAQDAFDNAVRISEHNDLANY